MKKAIICFGLVTILLLTGFSVAGSRVSTLEKNFVSKQVVKQNAASDLPDLTARIDHIQIIWERVGTFKRVITGYVSSFYIKNIGTAALLKENSPVFEVRFIAEKDGVEYINTTRESWYGYPSPWEPDVEVGYSHPWDNCPAGSTLKVWVDPNNLIQEENEDNNIAEAVAPNSYSYPTVLKNLQFSHSYQQINLQFNKLIQMITKTTTI